MIDLTKYRDKLTCETCGGSGKTGETPTIVVPCTCQDDERALMAIIKHLNAFYEWCQLESHAAKTGAEYTLTTAAIELARMCVARDYVPKKWDLKWTIREVIHKVTDTAYQRMNWHEWAGKCFNGIYSLADQAGFDLDEAIEERLG